MTVDTKAFAEDNNACMEHFLRSRKNEIALWLATHGERSLLNAITKFGSGSFKATLVAIHYLVEEGVIDGLSPYDTDAPDDLSTHIISCSV
jgi:hypothetical protein